MDYTLKASINRLKIISLYLFVFTNIALFGTLFFHNILTQANYGYPEHGEYSQTIKNIECNEDSNFCYSSIPWRKFSETLSPCFVTSYETIYNVDGLVLAKGVAEYVLIAFDENKKIKPKYRNSNIFISFEKSNNKNMSCIKNYPISYSLYKVSPKLPRLIVDIKRNPNYFDPTKKVVNPFFYGETSISNIAKRYPLYLIFKPFLFITSLLMVFYWVYTKKIICSFNKKEEIQIYYISGILSGIFLFLHVLLLGAEIENQILHKLKRSLIILFIFFELLAQLFLIKKLLNMKEIINNFIKNAILQIKKYLVLLFISLTIIITLLLIIFDLSKEVNYIIEWNYFVILSFYYLLTFYLWKKS